MTNPISHPLVENVVSPDLEGLVSLDAESGGMAVVTINRPQLNNAINSEVAQALKEAFETLHGADHVRIVFVRGAGGCFSGGADLDWLKTAAEDWDESDLREDAVMMAQALAALTHVPALTVALVEGEASGYGAGLVAACDMAIAAADARFAFRQVKMGAVPAVLAPFVVNAIGPRQAKQLFMTGRWFDAAYAQQIGLVQQIADPGTLGEAMERLTDEVLENGPEAMHAAKRLVWDVWGRPIDHGLMEETARLYAKTRFSEEGREGLAATLAGRKPGWANP